MIVFVGGLFGYDLTVSVIDIWRNTKIFISTNVIQSSSKTQYTQKENTVFYAMWQSLLGVSGKFSYQRVSNV